MSVSHCASSSHLSSLASVLESSPASERTMRVCAAAHHYRDLKSVVARFDAGELITQRAVSRQVSDDLTERSATFGLILNDVSLTHLSFGKEFTEAMKAKQAEQQKKAAIISAEGDSKAAELIANSLAAAGDGLTELGKLKAAEDIAYQLSASQNITYLPVSLSMLLQLPQ
ncbi:Prohibitin-1, subunit of the prohibitin complex (Phb1p-Phb2p) [Saguinus oedipus]|uniref:Prohibitin n=1 Tax=Saguinus oedipus TaxID=9490 RepID=A0ABQ9WBT2_SAGOE|nr:Prohibitin-1, subunit of the prohibitin complex (Phb1p-Phb2p) [Saguinus oedipus]